MFCASTQKHKTRKGKEMEKRYNLNDALFAIGLNKKWKQALFLKLHKKELNYIHVHYGVTLPQTVEMIESLSKFERIIYGIKLK